MTRDEIRQLIDQRIEAKARPPVMGRVRSVGPNLRAVLDDRHPGEWVPNVKPIMSPGIVGRLPKGAEVLVHSIGGSTSNPAYAGVNDWENAPATEEGEVVVYHVGGSGDFIKIRNGRIIEIYAATNVLVRSDSKVEVHAPEIEATATTFTVNGHLQVNGTLTVTGAVQLMLTLVVTGTATAADFIAGAFTFLTHRHTSAGSGSPSSTPI